MTPSSLTVLDRRAAVNRRLPLVAATGAVFLTALGLPGVALADQTAPPATPAPTTPAPQTPTPGTPAPPETPPVTPEQPTTTTANPVLPPGVPMPNIPDVPQPTAKTPATPLPTSSPDTTVTGIKGAMLPTTLFNGKVPGQPLPGDPTQVVSLPDSIAIAMARTPAILQAEESAYNTIKIVEEIEAIKKPQVSGTVNYSRLANAASSAFAGGASPGSLDVPFSVGLTTTPPGSTPIALSSSTTSSGSTVSTTSGTSTSSGSTTSPTTTTPATTSGATTTPAAAISTTSGDPIAAADTSSTARAAALSRQTTGSTTTTTTGSSTTSTAASAASVPGTDLNTFGAHVTVSQLIDITGIVKVAEEYGHLQEAFSRLELARIRQQTVYNVRNSYYNLLRAIAFDAVDLAAVADSQELLRVTQAQKDAGVASQFDVLNAQTQLETNQQALISARNQVALSKNAFANTLGLDPSTLVMPEPQVIPKLPNLDENALLHSAFAQRPEYLESDINLLKAGVNIRLSRRNLEPYLNAGVTAGYDPFSDGFDGNHATASVGVILTVPLYDGGATRAEVDQAKSSQRVAYVQKDEFVKGIKAEVQQSIIAITDANQRISSVASSVKDAEATLELAKIRFKAGVGTQLDVTQAEAELVQAESNQVNAQFDYLGAVARLDLAVGTPQ